MLRIVVYVAKWVDKECMQTCGGDTCWEPCIWSTESKFVYNCAVNVLKEVESLCGVFDSVWFTIDLPPAYVVKDAQFFQRRSSHGKI